MMKSNTFTEMTQVMQQKRFKTKSLLKSPTFSTTNELNKMEKFSMEFKNLKQQFESMKKILNDRINEISRYKKERSKNLANKRRLNFKNLLRKNKSFKKNNDYLTETNLDPLSSLIILQHSCHNDGINMSNLDEIEMIDRNEQVAMSSNYNKHTTNANRTSQRKKREVPKHQPSSSNSTDHIDTLNTNDSDGSRIGVYIEPNSALNGHIVFEGPRKGTYCIINNKPPFYIAKKNKIFIKYDESVIKVENQSMIDKLVISESKNSTNNSCKNPDVSRNRRQKQDDLEINTIKKKKKDNKRIGKKNKERNTNIESATKNLTRIGTFSKDDAVFNGLIVYKGRRDGLYCIINNEKKNLSKKNKEFIKYDGLINQESPVLNENENNMSSEQSQLENRIINNVDINLNLTNENQFSKSHQEHIIMNNSGENESEDESEVLHQNQMLQTSFLSNNDDDVLDYNLEDEYISNTNRTSLIYDDENSNSNHPLYLELDTKFKRNDLNQTNYIEESTSLNMNTVTFDINEHLIDKKKQNLNSYLIEANTIAIQNQLDSFINDTVLLNEITVTNSVNTNDEIHEVNNDQLHIENIAIRTIENNHNETLMNEFEIESSTTIESIPSSNNLVNNLVVQQNQMLQTTFDESDDDDIELNNNKTIEDDSINNTSHNNLINNEFETNNQVDELIQTNINYLNLTSRRAIGIFIKDSSVLNNKTVYEGKNKGQYCLMDNGSMRYLQWFEKNNIKYSNNNSQQNNENYLTDVNNYTTNIDIQDSSNENKQTNEGPQSIIITQNVEPIRINNDFVGQVIFQDEDHDLRSYSNSHHNKINSYKTKFKNAMEKTRNCVLHEENEDDLESLKDQFQSLFDDLCEENRVLKAKYNENQILLTNYESIDDSVSSEIQHLKSNIIENLNKIKKLQENLENEKKKAEGLHKENKNFSDEITELKETVSLIAKKNEDLTKKIELLKQQASFFSNNNNNEAVQIKNLKMQLSSIEKEFKLTIEQAVKNSDANRTRIKNLTDQNHKLIRKRKVLEKRIKELQESSTRNNFNSESVSEPDTNEQNEQTIRNQNLPNSYSYQEELLNIENENRVNAMQISLDEAVEKIDQLNIVINSLKLERDQAQRNYEQQINRNIQTNINTDLLRQIDELKSKINHLESLRALNTASNNENSDKIDDLKNRNHVQSNEISSLKEQIEILNKNNGDKIQQLNKKITDLEKNNTNLKHQNEQNSNTNRTKIESLEAQIETLSAQKEVENNTNLAKICNLENYNNALTRRINQLDEINNENRNRIQDFRNQNEQLRVDNTTKTTRIIELETQSNELRLSNENNNTNSNSRVSELETSLNQANENFNAIRTTNDELLMQNQDLVDRNNALQTENNRLTRINQTNILVNANIETIRNTNLELQETIDNLNQRLENANRDVDHWTQVNNHHLDSITNLQNRVAENGRGLFSLEEENRQLRNQIETLNNRLSVNEGHVDRIAQLNNENIELSDQIHNLNNNISLYDRRINELLIQNEQFSSNFNQMNQIMGDYEAQIQNLNNKVANAEKQINDLKIEKKKLEKEVTKLNNQLLAMDSDSDDDENDDNDDWLLTDEDEDDGFYVLDPNSIFNVRNIRNQKNPASACPTYGCTGKNNTGFHKSKKNCPKFQFMNLSSNNCKHNTINSNLPNFKTWRRGETFIIGIRTTGKEDVYKGPNGGIFYIPRCGGTPRYLRSDDPTIKYFI